MPEMIKTNAQKLADTIVDIESMTQELEAYIVDQDVYRTVLISTADGNRKVEMSGGDLLGRINQLQESQGQLSPAQQEQLKAIDADVQRTIYSLRTRFHELLRRELRSRHDQLALNVYRYWRILAGPDSERWQEWGPLDADHRWHFEFKQKFENDNDQDINATIARRDYAEYTKDTSSSGPEEYEIHEPESNPGNDRFYVNCAGCGREIEFGWSESNRGGGIFPVEFADFSPKGLWPEPRYLNAWQQRGWLTTEDSPQSV